MYAANDQGHAVAWVGGRIALMMVWSEGPEWPGPVLRSGRTYAPRSAVSRDHANPHGIHGRPHAETGRP